MLGEKIKLLLPYQESASRRSSDTATARIRPSLTQQLEEDRVPDMETIGRLRGAIVNLETVRKNVEKARTDRDEAMKALLRAEKNVNDSPFAGQTAESARKEAQGTSSDRVPRPQICFIYLPEFAYSAHGKSEPPLAI